MAGNFTAHRRYRSRKIHPTSRRCYFESMKWLGLDWDQEPIFQYSRSVRHQDIAQQLLDRGAALQMLLHS